MKKSSFVILLAAACMLGGTGLKAVTQQPNELPKQKTHNVLGGFYSDWTRWRKGWPGTAQAVPWDKVDFVAMAFWGIAQAKHCPSAWDTPSKASYNLTTYGGLNPITNFLGGTQWTSNPNASAPWAGCTFAADPETDRSFLQELNTLMAAKGKPVMISLGGWSYTHRFRDMAAWDNYQAGAQLNNLMRDINMLKNQNWFGGVDLDWEYPVRGHGSPEFWKNIPQEAEYFKILIEKLGEAMKGTSANGQKLYFSIDLPCSNEAIDEMFDHTTGLAEVINNNVSFITLMAYDMHGEYEAATPGSTAKSMSDPDEIEPVIRHLVNDLGIKPEKILLGMPNYAREMIVTSDTNGGYDQPLLPVEIYQADTSYIDPANIEPYPGVGGMVDNTGVYYYSQLANKLFGTNYPDAVEAKPYPGMRDTGGEALPATLQNQVITDKNISWAIGPFGSVQKLGLNGVIPGQFFQGYPVFTFDTPASVKYKVDNLVKKYDLGGVSFWELYGDAYSAGDWQFGNRYSNIFAAREALDSQ
ncbi:glycoside hydrolase family 18 protein [Lentisphaerota bacterium ZTH]|nr:glycoside hydrolase family 18 protein [Lentisphaerota bacterium]WET06554.1 glycoside hydrolase family 18 protein [Lentisphaerota bacterium ZTH]